MVDNSLGVQLAPTRVGKTGMLRYPSPWVNPITPEKPMPYVFVICLLPLFVLAISVLPSKSDISAMVDARVDLRVQELEGDIAKLESLQALAQDSREQACNEFLDALARIPRTPPLFITQECTKPAQ
jgi:hypothetical protein